ncbi:MAG TPA: hypothetical protein VLJ37_04180 [bacterium]|nr:hypothetical protein [bacterium]
MKKVFLFSLSLFLFLLAALVAEAKNCNGVGRCGDDGSNCTVTYPDSCNTAQDPGHCRDAFAYCTANDTGSSQGAAQDSVLDPDDHVQKDYDLQTAPVFLDDQEPEDSPALFARALAAYALRGRRPGRWHTH